MSKAARGTRTKNVRETYVEHLPYGQGLTGYMNQKRKPFTHLNSVDSDDLPFRSTSEYLRELHQQHMLPPEDMIYEMNVPRTKTANELALKSQTNRPSSGNPKYKAQEDYYEEIQLLKKEMKTMKNDNSILRAKIRRLEEDNVRKRKQIETIYDSNKDGDLPGAMTGSLTDRTNNNYNNNNANGNVVLRLKQRIFKLESQLKEKETRIEEIQSDPKWTRSKELEVQNRALMGEIQRQKVEQSNYLQLNNYPAMVADGKVNTIRKLTADLDDSRKENESLKKKVEELERIKSIPTGSADDRNHSELIRTVDTLKQKCKHFENEIRETDGNLEAVRLERDEYRKKFDRASEELDNKRHELANIQQELNKLKQGKQSGRSSPSIKPEDIQEIRENFSSPKPSVKGGHLLTTGSRTPRISPNASGRSTPVEAPKRVSSRPTTPVRKSHEPISSRKSSISESTVLSNASPKKLHNRDPTTLDDSRVKRFREKHAATVIQRGWRGHDKPRKDRLYESAIKTVQAELRGFLNRSASDKVQNNKSSPTPKPRSKLSSTKSEPTESDDNEDSSIVTPSKPSRSLYNSDAKRDFPTAARAPNTKNPSPMDKIPANAKSFDKSKEPDFKSRRTPTPPLHSSRPSSPSAGNSKQNLLSNRDKIGPSSRPLSSDREQFPKSKNSASPTSSPAKKDHQSSSYKPSNPIPSKASVKSDIDDDDDVAWN